MCVDTSGTSKLNFGRLELIWNSIKGTQSCDSLVSKRFVGSLSQDRVVMAKARAFSQVVPHFGKLLKITYLCWGLKCSWANNIHGSKGTKNLHIGSNPLTKHPFFVGKVDNMEERVPKTFILVVIHWPNLLSSLRVCVSKIFSILKKINK